MNKGVFAALQFTQKGILLLSLSFVLLYCLALFYPESWWGLHHHYFLSFPAGYVFQIIALVLLYFSIQNFELKGFTLDSNKLIDKVA